MSENRSDAELAADARMVASEFSSLLIELKKRGIEVDISRYESGRFEIDVYRETRETI